MKAVHRFMDILLLIICVLIPVSSFASAGETAIFYGEETAIGSIASYQNNLYILRYEGLFVYDATTMKENLVTDRVSSYWRSSAYTDLLCADSSGLYGFNIGTLTLTQILNENATLVDKTFLKAECNNDFDTAFLQDGFLYMLSTDGKQQTLHKIALTGDAEETTIKVKDISLVTTYQPGYAIAIVSSRIEGKLVSWLSRLDLTNGSTQHLAQLEQSVNAITYDHTGNRVYLAGQAKLFIWQEGTDITFSAYTLGGDTGAIAAFGMNMAGIIVDNSVVIRNTHSDTKPRSIVLQQPYGRSENYQAFLTTHPEISLLFEGDPSGTPEEQFIEDMTTRNSFIDIYLLTDINLLTTINEKAYGVDMSTDVEIGSVVADLYNPWRNLFEQNGAIFTMPQSLFVTMLGYNTEFFEKFGFEIPTTYDELLALAQVWLNDYADDYPEVYFNPFENGIELIPILRRYADECTGNDHEIVYHQPTMITTLQDYLDISNAYKEYRFSGRYDLYAFNVIDVPYVGQNAYMPLTVEPENQPVISGADVELAYFVINPYSTHQADSLAFIRSTVNAWSDMEKVLLQKSAAKPVQRSDYACEKATIERDLNALRTRLSASDAVGAATLQAQIEDKTAELNTCEDRRWDITQAGVDWYQSVVDRIVMSKLNPLTVLMGKQADIFEQFLHGDIDAQRFTKLIDEKIRSIYLEAK